MGIYILNFEQTSRCIPKTLLLRTTIPKTLIQSPAASSKGKFNNQDNHRILFVIEPLEKMSSGSEFDFDADSDNEEEKKNKTVPSFADEDTVDADTLEKKKKDEKKKL